MAKAIIISVDSNHLCVSGDIDFHNAPVLLRQGQELLQGKQDVLIDFSQLKRSNSAGLAVCTGWLRYAKHHKIKLRLQNLPHQLLAIAKVSGVAALLEE